MEILVFCNACKQKRTLETMDSLADAADCCDAGLDRYRSRLTILVDEDSASEFTEQLATRPSDFPFLPDLSNPLSLVRNHVVLYWVIMGPRVAVFCSRPSTYERLAFDGDPYDLGRVTVRSRLDHLFCYFGLGASIAGRGAGPEKKLSELVPLEDLAVGDDRCLEETLDRHAAEVDADGRVLLSFDTTTRGDTDFETREWGVRIKRVSVTLDPADPAQMEVNIFDVGD